MRKWRDILILVVSFVMIVLSIVLYNVEKISDFMLLQSLFLPCIAIIYFAFDLKKK